MKKKMLILILAIFLNPLFVNAQDFSFNEKIRSHSLNIGFFTATVLVDLGIFSLISQFHYRYQPLDPFDINYDVIRMFHISNFTSKETIFSIFEEIKKINYNNSECRTQCKVILKLPLQVDSITFLIEYLKENEKNFETISFNIYLEVKDNSEITNQTIFSIFPFLQISGVWLNFAFPPKDFNSTSHTQLLSQLVSSFSNHTPSVINENYLY